MDLVWIYLLRYLQFLQAHFSFIHKDSAHRLSDLQKTELLRADTHTIMTELVEELVFALKGKKDEPISQFVSVNAFRAKLTKLEKPLLDYYLQQSVFWAM